MIDDRFAVDLGRFAEGEEGYFEELVRTFGPLVESVTAAFRLDPDHAEDLFQEIWKRVYEKRETFGSSGSFEGWLQRLAQNVCLAEYKARRSQSRRIAKMEEESGATDLGWKPPDPSEEAERGEFRGMLQRALSQLSEREHEALTLRVLEEKSPAEVAELMGVERSTVRSHIRFALKRMREIIEDPEYELS